MLDLLKIIPPYMVVFIGFMLSSAGAVIAAWGGLLHAQRQQAANLELFNQVTGGQSAVYVEPLRKAGRVRFYVRQNGQHPTYDVVVRVQEVVRRADGTKNRLLLFGPTDIGRTFRRGSGFDWTYPGPTSSDKRAWPLEFLEPPKLNTRERTYRIEFAARNGIIIQVVKVWAEKGLWFTDSEAINGPGSAPPPFHADFREAQVQSPNPPEHESAPEDDLS
ncbi:MAG TPA: hypothetical protein VE932_04920 [Patescibacteria group bacterium]|nr:hypothetical protein [Patescibacteria group bacterium]